MITPHTLTRIERYTGIESPESSKDSISLLRFVKLGLFNESQLNRLLNIPDVASKKFVIAGIVNAIETNPVFSSMRAIPVSISNSFRNWIEPKYDLQCSTKIDLMDASGIIDIRLTSCKTLEEFIVQCYAYKYHRTAAFVCDGLHKKNYIIIGVNKKTFKTFTFNISKHEDYIAEGRNEYEELIDKFLLMNEVDKDRILQTTF